MIRRVAIAALAFAILFQYGALSCAAAGSGAAASCCEHACPSNAGVSYSRCCMTSPGKITQEAAPLSAAQSTPNLLTTYGFSIVPVSRSPLFPKCGIISPHLSPPLSFKQLCSRQI
ncbi:MAG: hypothetical protein ACREP6_00870 [Candidatus Binataceae bacterium]